MSTPETLVLTDERNGVTIFRYEGDITSFSETAVLGAFRHLLPEKKEGLVLDFSKVDYINSSGVALIITLVSEATKASQRVACFGLTEHFLKVFDLVGLLRHLASFGSEDEAIKSLET